MQIENKYIKTDNIILSLNILYQKPEFIIILLCWH